MEYIRDIVEDEHGLLWFGSIENGLYKFDPIARKLTAYHSDSTDVNSLSDDRIDALHVDGRGRLWVGTVGGCLDVFDRDREAFIRYSYANFAENDEAQFGIHAIEEDANGHLWLGTTGAGLLRFDPATETFDTFSPAIDGHGILSIAFLNEHTLLLGTEKAGLVRFDIQNNAVYPNEIMPADNNSIVRAAALSTQDGMVWIGTRDNGVLRFSLDRRTVESFRLGPPDTTPATYEATTIVRDRSGVLWIGTMGGLFKMTQSPFAFLPSWPDPSIEILPVYEDRDGVLWMGTDGAGLLSYDPRTEKKHQYTSASPNGLADNRVFSIIPGHDNTLWIGTFGGGLNRFDPETETFESFVHDPQNASSLGSNIVWPIVEGHSDDLWVGTVDGGLNRLDLNTYSFTRYSVEDGLSLDRITSIALEKSGKLWLGTAGGGLNYFDPDTKAVTIHRYDRNDESTISGDRLLSLFLDRTETLWIGTAGNGLNSYNRSTGQFSRYTTDEGLISNWIFEIREDKNGYLWISTDSGISRLNPADTTFVNYSELDGLELTSFRIGNPVPRSSSNIHFGGLGGVASFVPELITNNEYQPPILLTDFKLFGESYPLPKPLYATEEIVLAHTENAIDISFAALDYTNPPKNRYKYILEGYDLEWIDNETTPTARFRSLPSGNFTLRVRGSNSDGLWSEHEAVLRIRILPPFYLRWWFLLLSGFLVLGFAYSIHRFRVTRLLENERMRLKIASDLHDELGANLSSISLYSEILTEKGVDPDEARGHALTIQDTVKATISALRETIWMIDPRHDQDRDVVKRMEMLAKTMLSHLSYSFETEGTEVVDIRDMQRRRHVLMAYKEMLHNIIKHAQATEVDIRIERDASWLITRVSDNGRGFDLAQSSDGHGLKNLRMRAEQSEGSVDIESRPDHGTTITFRVKMA